MTTPTSIIYTYFVLYKLLFYNILFINNFYLFRTMN